jgi:hypothetical protein
MKRWRFLNFEFNNVIVIFVPVLFVHRLYIMIMQDNVIGIEIAL